jgi:hypothetical protein
VGVRFLMENRRRAKGLGGRELTLAEARAVRTVLQKRGRATDEQLAEMDADIRRMASVKLLEDLDTLRAANEPTLVKLERRPNAQLSRDDRVRLLAWLDRVEDLQANYREHLHIGHLLTAGNEANPILWDLNLAFLQLATLSHADVYWEQGLITPDMAETDERLIETIDAMTAKSPLSDYLEDGPWFGPPRRLRALPADRIQRARLLHIYQSYLELAMVATVWGDPAGLVLPTLGRKPRLLSYQALQQENNPETWLRGMLEELGVRLVLNLSSGSND